jgi:hypothetical protein
MHAAATEASASATAAAEEGVVDAIRQHHCIYSQV